MNEPPIIQKIVVGAVVISGDKVLTLQRAADESAFPGLWELPSGKRNPFEACATTAGREVKEETGLDVDILTPISTFEYRLDKSAEVRDCVQINFLARPRNEGAPKVELSSEHQAFAWVGESELDKHEMSPETRRTIMRGLQTNHPRPSGRGWLTDSYY